jgi:hypothetical protein
MKEEDPRRYALILAQSFDIKNERNDSRVDKNASSDNRIK